MARQRQKATASRHKPLEEPKAKSSIPPELAAVTGDGLGVSHTYRTSSTYIAHIRTDTCTNYTYATNARTTTIQRSPTNMMAAKAHPIHQDERKGRQLELEEEEREREIEGGKR